MRFAGPWLRAGMDAHEFFMIQPILVWWCGRPPCGLVLSWGAKAQRNRGVRRGLCAVFMGWLVQNLHGLFPRKARTLKLAEHLHSSFPSSDDGCVDSETPPRRIRLAGRAAH